MLKASRISESDLIMELKVKKPLGGSDNNMTKFNLHVEREKKKSDMSVLVLSKGD